ncbi:hypothetical protein SEVIR_5G417901v4 [Setaria viridis]|uniref:Uncharacterized protein n=1 Tax=Setaria italica TaxID=4555 RepID=K3XNI8_SETIT
MDLYLLDSFIHKTRHAEIYINKKIQLKRGYKGKGSPKNRFFHKAESAAATAYTTYSRRVADWPDLQSASSSAFPVASTLKTNNNLKPVTYQSSMAILEFLL